MAAKLARLRAAMAAQGLDAVALNHTYNVAWLAAGAATYVNSATDGGVVTLFVTADQAIAITDTIEAPRMEQEEALAALGFAIQTEPWYARGALLRDLLHDRRAWRDVDSAGDFASAMRQLRTTLQAEEIARLHVIAQEAAAAVEATTRAARPGMSEFAIAAQLDHASWERGGQAIVNLVATDERIYQYRHPLPTAKILDRYAMVVLCYRKDGLVISATRLVHFGPPPEALRAIERAAAEIDVRIIAATQPGRTLGDLFAVLKASYAEVGYPAAIEEHHQGGMAGYKSREVLATPGETATVALNQIYAWNPSIRGIKSEDTVLIASQGPAVVTATGDWPTIAISVAGQTIARPGILVL